MNNFDLINDLYFVRVAGSKEEHLASNIIKERALKYTSDVKLEEFDVDAYEIERATIEFLSPNINIKCVGVGMSGSTNETLEKDFKYIQSVEDLDFVDVSNSICLVHQKIVNQKLYEGLVKNKAQGLILCVGSVYDDKTDYDPYMYRNRHYDLGKIPAVAISFKDASKILEVMPKKVRMELKQKEMKAKSYNVVATLKGEENFNDVIAFSAHYDSVSYSKGAYDNASGSACIMDLLAKFSKEKPKRTLKFIWCGSEENGLLGSKEYTSRHKEELDNYRLNINVDMVGVTLGYDICKVSGENELCSYIKYTSKELGFPLNVSQGIYSSDSTPFADHLVPSMSFARLAPQGGATIHSRKDIIENLSLDNYLRTTNFIYEFAKRLVDSKVFPVVKKIPDNIKEEIDKYYFRKD